MNQEKAENKYFAHVFTKLMNEWKKNTGKSQENFAELVGVMSANSVSDWKRGKSFPSEKSMQKICEILNVDESTFYPQIKIKKDKYKYDPQFITRVGRDRSEFAKKIGFDMELLAVLRRHINFEESFPIYSNIVPAPDSSLLDPIYIRNTNFADSMTIIDEELRDLQLYRDGKLVTLHDIDIAFLKEVQDQIVHFVEYLFYKRSKEMEEEVKTFNEDFKKTPIVGIIHLDAEGKSIFTPLQQKIQDKYLNLTNDENLLKPENEDKLIKAIEDLVDIGPSDIIDIKYPKVDKEHILSHDRFARYFESIFPEHEEATQEDIDSYFGHGTKRSEKNG